MANNLISNYKRDRLLRQCESLMLRGVDSPTDLSGSLNVSYNTAKSYVSLIRERWASLSTIDELQAKRQELIRKTEEIIKVSWELKKTAKNTLEATGALRTALLAIERLERLQGINQLPLPIEKPKMQQISELAHKINQLPVNEKQKYVLRVREEIKKRGIRLNPIYQQ